MPWKVEKQGEQFCVVNSQTGKTVHCHPTRDKALAQMRALYANVPDAKAAAVEWETVMRSIVAGYDDAHPFGWATVELQPSGKQYIAAVAETDGQKTRGMIGRRFDQFSAMLFAYDEPVTHEFHVRGCVEQLYIAWFDADSQLVDRAGMYRGDPWTYRPVAAYRWALELPAVEGTGGTTVPGGAGAVVGNAWAWLDGQTLTVEPFEPLPDTPGWPDGVRAAIDRRGFFAFNRERRTRPYPLVDRVPHAEVQALASV
jgi:uncharacterized membrane protein (UPF0127 family)